MPRAALTPFQPVLNAMFVVDAKTLQASYCLAFLQFFKTNDAFTFGISQNILVVSEPRLGQTHHYMRLDVIGRYHFIAYKTFEISHAKKEWQRLCERTHVVIPMRFILVRA